MKRLLKVALTYSGIEGLQKGIYFLLIPLITFYIPPKEYGTLSIILMLISFFQLIFTFSIEANIMRFYTKFKNEKMKKTFLGTLILASIMFIFLWNIFLIVIGPSLFKYFFPLLSFSPYILLAILITSFKMLNLLYITFLKSIQDLKEFARYYNAYFFLQTIIILLFIIYFPFKKDIIYLYALLLAQILPIGYIILQMRNKILFHLHKKILLFSLSYGFSLIPIKIANVINNSIDRYLLFNLISSSIAGIYYLGWQIATIMQVLMLAINSAYVPKFFQLYENNKITKNFDEIYKINYNIIFIVAILESLILIVYPILFHFIDPLYLKAQQIIPIFILFFSLNMVYFFNTNALSISASLNRKKVYGVLLGIITNAIISLMLMKTYGMMGVAIGSLIGQFTSIIYFIFLVKKYTKFKFNNLLYLILISVIFIINIYIESIAFKSILLAIILWIYYIKVKNEA